MIRPKFIFIVQCILSLNMIMVYNHTWILDWGPYLKKLSAYLTEPMLSLTMTGAKTSLASFDIDLSPLKILNCNTGGINTVKPRQNRCHFADSIFKCIFLNENVLILIKISVKFIPKDPINNIPALVQIMAWSRLGDKPLHEAMMFRLPMHICVILPQWVNNHDYIIQSHII